MRRVSWLNFIFLCSFSLSTFADTAFTQRKDVQAFIKQMVKQYHFNQNDLTNTFNHIQLQPQLIKSMDMPFEKKSWDIYRKLFLTSDRLKKGLAFWSANQNTLTKVQKRYGVPPEIIVAILGVESLYGEKQGENNVLDTLATFAFDYPKRATFFTRELQQYLLLCREQHVAMTHYKGSYAGAIGKPQFMPSSYRHFAVDYAHKGHRDLVQNNEDAIASIANYFHLNGWKMNDGIAQSAKITASRAQRVHMNPWKANYSYAQLMNSGIKPVTAAHNHPARAGVIELNTAKAKEYWLAYPNFFVIMRYNPNPQYALVVYLLSQQLKQQWIEMNIKKHRAYA